MIIVVGAGVIGISVAYNLILQNKKVLIIDDNQLQQGTSYSSFAWVNAQHKLPKSYYDINRLGMAAHQKLASRFGASLGFHQTGTIAWEADATAYHKKVALMSSFGYQVAWLSSAQQQQIIPAINTQTEQVAYFAEDGWLDTRQYINTLLTYIKQHGGVHIQEKVTRLTFNARQVTGVVTEGGQSYNADQVVNCTGRWAQSLFGSSVDIPMTPTDGLLVYVKTDFELDHVIMSPNVHMRPDGHGRVLICHNSLVVDPAWKSQLPEKNHPFILQLLHDARSIVPALADATIDEIRVGIRAIPQDQYPAIGKIPEVDHYYVALAHSGVTLAPYIGEAVADELITNQQRAELAEFRPARFFKQ